eukprot:COSAG02_NODE_8066_length_2722_cov_2.690431_3_plen_36_part_00
MSIAETVTRMKQGVIRIFAHILKTGAIAQLKDVRS